AFYRKLAVERPDDPELLEELSRSYVELVRLLNRMGREDEGDLVLNECLDFWRKLVAGSPAVPDYRHQLAELLWTNVNERRWSRPEQCDRMLREALSLAERLTDEHPESRNYRRQLILCRTRLAWFLEDFRRFEEAEAFGGLAVALAEQMQTEFPEDAEIKATIAYAARIKGVALMAKAQLAEAERMFVRSRDILEGLAGGGAPYDDWDLAMTHRELARLLAKDADRLDEAERSYRREVALVEKSVATDPARAV